MTDALAANDRIAGDVAAIDAARWEKLAALPVREDVGPELERRRAAAEEHGF